jgi:hypothetical protein
MSSVTSTDGSSFRAWHFFVVLTLLAATAAVLTSRIVTPEHLILLSLTVFAAGGASLAIYRMLMPFAGRDTRLSSETLGHRARAALEREKQLVLRSIKELEFDRAMGKLAPGDFDDMSARLKLRALRLMQQLDADAVAPRERLERELAERLRGGATAPSSAVGADASSRPSDHRADAAGVATASASALAPQVGAVVCADCGAANDADARFCKACGTRLAAATVAGTGAEHGPGTSARSIGVTLLLAGALTASGLLAPALSQSAFAQMPDLSQMSGQPLPSGDVPAGTVSVRVIRQTMSNNVAGVEVQLEAPPQTLKATTDANGRAVFPNVAQGLTWKAVTIVDGERLESQPFTIPASGGLRMLLVSGLKNAPASGVAAPSASPSPSVPGGAAGAASEAVPGEVTLGGQSRFVVELAERNLEVYGLFELTNLSASSVMPAKPIVFEAPAEAKTVSVLEGSTPMAKAEGNRVTVTGPFAPGVTNVQIAYRFPYSGGSARITQALPMALGQTTVILRKIDGLQFHLANGQGQRDVPLEGRMYVVLNGGAIPVGTPLDLTLSGLPHHAAWPLYVGIGLGALIVIGGGVLAFRGAAASGAAGREEDARALKARRAALFEQLVSLERRRTGKLRDDPGLMARRNELMSQLEPLDESLAEVSITAGTAGAGEGQAAASSSMTVEPRSESLNAGSAAR